MKKFIPPFFLNWYHLGVAILGAIIYRFPSRNLCVVGVTGTNGKSTVVNLVSQIFEEAGFKTASLSSIRFRIGEREWTNALKMTMPGRFRLQKFLRDAVRRGCTHAVIEVTSEGIKQWRHWGIDFDIAVLTNVTPEHIESHGSFEKYREAKTKLFRSLRAFRGKAHKTISVINVDDKNAEYFLGFKANETWGYGVLDTGFDPVKSLVTRTVRAKNIVYSGRGVEFDVDNATFRIKLHGVFNVYNALAAISIALSQGIRVDSIRQALERVEVVPGRFEIVVHEPFFVIVDYAHTPDALENAYKTAESLKSRSSNTRLICVLGAAGGGRDRWKRPELGKLAEKHCAEIILTDEDPYDENPEAIVRDIESGFSPNSSHEKNMDRRMAIRDAIRRAGSGDIVIITGKGCEPWMMVARGEKIPWDDRKIVREEFEHRDKENFTNKYT